MSKSRICRLVVACGSTLAVSVVAEGQQQLRVWQGIPGGLYNVAANWSPAGVPTNGGGITYAVAIPTGMSCVDNLSVTVDRLAVGEVAQFTINPGVNFSVVGQVGGVGNVGAIDNDGLISLTGAGSAASIFATGGAGATVTFGATGPGTARINTTNSINNFIAGTGMETFVFGASSIFEGAGRIGNNSLRVQNAGEIRAVGSAGLVIDPNPSGMTSSGLLRADSGSLTLTNGTFDCTGGMLVAGGAPIIINNARVIGGTWLAPAAPVFTVQALSTLVDANLGGRVEVPNGASVFLEGTIRLLDSGSSLNLLSSGLGVDVAGRNTVNILGPGSINLSNSTTNRLVTALGTGTLHLMQSARIRGSGQVGAGSAGLILDPFTLIEAEGSAGLTIDPSALGCMNAGTLSAAGGSTLTLTLGLFDQSIGAGGGPFGGQIAAFDGATVAIQGAATVRGGSILSAGTGVCRAGGGAELDGVSSGAIIRVLGQSGGQILNLRTSLESSSVARLEVDANGFSAELRLLNDVALLGPGLITMSNSGNNRIHSPGASARLTQTAGHTIRGSGQLGFNSMAMTNAGLVEAEGAAGLTIDPGAGGVTNTGTLRARTGSMLTLTDGVFENQSIIEAETGGQCILTGATLFLSGGQLSGPGGFSWQAQAELASVTSNAALTIPNGQIGIARGMLTNNSTITLASTIGLTTLRIRGDTTIDGAGTIVLSDSTSNRLLAEVATSRLTIGTGQTIRGSGQIGANGTVVLNQGTILADLSAGMTLAASAGGFENQGRIFCTGAGMITIAGGPFACTGGAEVFVEETRRIARTTGDWLQAGGTCTIDGEIEVSGGLFLHQGGFVGGRGRLDADTINSGGFVEPGSLANGGAPGVLTIEGNYSQQGSGQLRIQLGGTTPGTHDQLVITGDAMLGGALDVRLADGFVPMLGQSFTILTAGAVLTPFATFTSGDGTQYSVEHNPTSVVITYTGSTTACAADFNSDGDLNPDDLGDFINCYFSVPPCPQADFNQDGDTNPDDLGDYINAYFAGCP